MYIPKTTYRIQFTASFTFKHLQEQLAYLEKLGIDTIYASPIFKAQKGSTHGYDVTDFACINPELGTEEEFRELIEKLHERNIGWIQDIVPNHMAFSVENPYLLDVLKFGQKSKHARLFDIFWNYHDPKIRGKLMAPVLGKQLEEVIEADELSLQFNNGNFALNYYENNFPLHERSVEHLIALAHGGGTALGESNKSLSRNSGIEICNFVNKNHQLLEEIISYQHYYLCHWQITEKKINYRRFFTVNDLICLRQEDPEVFKKTHQFIADLYIQGYFQGIRVDHIDGLLKPAEYLQNLRSLLGDDAYILVEKILGKDEKLPEEWPVQGATGYNYLGAVNELLIKKQNKPAFTEIYHDLIGANLDYQTMVKRKKRFVLRQRMAGELDNLLNLLQDGSAKSDTSLNYKEATTSLLTSFPVYRTYIENESQKGWHKIFEDVAAAHPELRREFEEIKKVFFLHNPSDMQFVLRFQQLSGPLAAKGVEDTVFYQYNRFICQNEVGDEPLEFGVDVRAFHDYISERKEKWPLAMNNSSTHDTKRGEDTRARLTAISLNPQMWKDLINNLADRSVNSRPVPNDQYMIFQSLVGAWPFDGNIDEKFKQRFKEYLQKALREGKNQTSWSSPNQQYEKACFDFSMKLMENEEKKHALSLYVKQIAKPGIVNSINTIILKYALPGIPDLYQGCESWNFSFVDPDNRRPVSYGIFNQILDDLHAREEKQEIGEFVNNLWNEDPYNETLKIFITQKLVQLRRAEHELLVWGDYIPLESSANSIAFLRRFKGRWLFVYLTFEESNMELDAKQQNMPDEAPEKWENIFTRETCKLNENRANFPFICLLGKSG